MKQDTTNFQLNLFNSPNKELKFIDLFAGLGGTRIGLEQALIELGFMPKCVFTSEIKSYAIEAYKKNFNDDDIHGDITKIDSKDIPDFDILLAGFPCQPFSSAGSRKGFSDTRGTLFFEIERILKDKSPKGFLLENVEGLVNHNGGDTLKTILLHLEQLGYIVSWKVVNAAEIGVPQSRKRIYIVGNKKEKISLDDMRKQSVCLDSILEKGLPVLNTQLTKKLLSKYKLSDLYGKSIKDKRGGKNNIHSWDIELKGSVSDEQKHLLEKIVCERRNKKWASLKGITWMDGMPLTVDEISTFDTHDKETLEEMLADLAEKGYLSYEHPKEVVSYVENGKTLSKRVPDTSKPKGYNIVAGKLSFEISKILDPFDVAPTLVATDVSRLAVVDSEGLRRLSIREGLRLFGYPENYTLSMLSYADAYDLLGNTVVVPVIKEISLKLLKAILS